MKKIITFVTTTLLFIAGAMNLSAKSKCQEDVYYYAWLTSCGVEFDWEFDIEMDDEFCLDFLDFLEDLFCDWEDPFGD